MRAKLSTSNVLRLPTAAARKVNNHRFAEQRHAALEKHHAEPWPGDRRLDRQQRQLDDPIQSLRRSPEMFALLCIMTAFPADRLDGLQAAADLMLGRHRDDPDGQAGHALVKHAVDCRKALATLAGARE